MRITILVLAALAASPALAEGIPVEPGLWSVTTTMNMPMMPAPQTMTTEQCFEDDVMDMDDMATEGLDPGCKYDLSNIDGNTMAWSIDCPVEGGGEMHAEWQATSSGDSVEGEGKMAMTVAGQQMDMTMSWTGKRVGDCR